MAEDAQIRLTLETQEARRQVDRFKDELRKASDEAGKTADSAQGALLGRARAAVGLFGGAAVSGATAALTAPGAGASDAAYGASAAVGQTLRQQGQANFIQGVTSGNVGQAAGGIAQAGLGILEERTIGQTRRARNQAIAQVTGLTSGFAAEGIEIDQQALASAIEVAMVRANRQIQHEAAVRRAAPDLIEGARIMGVR